MAYRVFMTSLRDSSQAGWQNLAAEVGRAYGLPPDEVYRWARREGSAFVFTTRESAEQVRAWMETIGVETMVAEEGEGSSFASVPNPTPDPSRNPNPGGAYAPGAWPPPRINPQDEKLFAMLCHLSSLLGYLFPFANIIIPLVIWLVKKDESPLIDYHGKESVNFQISVTIYEIVAALSMLLLVGFVLLPVVMVFALVVVILASVKAYNGEPYRYPLCIRFIN